MADVHTPDVIPATNASNTTRYFHLPLFISTDKPSWLVDWNGAMGEIDTILQNINTASEGAVADVQTIQTQIDALNQLIPNLEATVKTAVSDVAAMQTTVAAQETRLDSVEQDLITQNNLVKQLSDAVVAMQSTVATLNNRVQVMETALQGVEVDVNTIRNQITSLDNRVTALENAPSATNNLSDFTHYEYTPYHTETIPFNEDITTSGDIGSYLSNETFDRHFDITLFMHNGHIPSGSSTYPGYAKLGISVDGCTILDENDVFEIPHGSGGIYFTYSLYAKAGASLTFIAHATNAPTNISQGEIRIKCYRERS